MHINQIHASNCSHGYLRLVPKQHFNNGRATCYTQISFCTKTCKSERGHNPEWVAHRNYWHILQTIAGAKRLQTCKHAEKVSLIVLRLQHKYDCKQWSPITYAHAHHCKQVPKQMQITQSLLPQCRWDKAFKYRCNASATQVQSKWHGNTNANANAMQV